MKRDVVCTCIKDGHKFFDSRPIKKWGVCPSLYLGWPVTVLTNGAWKK